MIVRGNLLLTKHSLKTDIGYVTFVQSDPQLELVPKSRGDLAIGVSSLHKNKKWHVVYGRTSTSCEEPATLLIYMTVHLVICAYRKTKKYTFHSFYCSLRQSSRNLKNG